jgi:hypothetical protein
MQSDSASGRTPVGGQLCVRISADLHRVLREGARRQHLKASEIVRMALRLYLAAPGPDGSRAAERVRGLIGSLDSAAADPVAQHRAAILEGMKR